MVNSISIKAMTQSSSRKRMCKLPAPMKRRRTIQARKREGYFYATDTREQPTQL
jgi:hypothetical protein